MVVKATGTLHARESATLSAQVVGRVQQVLVREGDVVSAGQTLAMLDDSMLRASDEQAEAAAKAAESQQAAAQTKLRPRRQHARTLQAVAGCRRA